MSKASGNSLLKKTVSAGPLLPLVLIALFAGSFVELDLSKSEHHYRRMVDFLHLPVFFILAWLLTDWLSGREKSLFKSALLAFGFCVLLGALTEIFQPFFGREGSFSDFWLDLLGSLAGAAFSLAMSSDSSKELRAFAFLILPFAIFLGAQPVYEAWSQWKLKEKYFPVLANVQPELLHWWKPTNEQSELTIGAQGLEVRAIEGGAVYEALGQNWLTLRKLSVAVFNPGDKFKLNLRVDDDQDCSEFSNRFNKGFELLPGLNQIEIPLSEISSGPENRTLDLSTVRFLYIFVLGGGSSGTSKKRTWEIREVKLR